MNFRLSDEQKSRIEKMHQENFPSRAIAEEVLGSSTKKSTVNNYLAYLRSLQQDGEESSDESSSSKTFLLTDSSVKAIIESKGEQGASVEEVSKFYDVPEYLIRKIYSGEVTEGVTPTDIDYYDRLHKKLQKQTDALRVERKAARESDRINNMLEELTGALVDVLDKHSMKDLVKSHKTASKAPIGVIHLSDLHFGETIFDAGENVFDLSVAAARLKKLVDRSKQYFKAVGVSDVLIALTGDIMNSDRRLDEITTNATNRARILFSAVDTLQQLILDVNEDFNVTVATVCGNESRIGKDVGWVDFTASDNFDAIIHDMLDRIFRGSKGVRFIPMTDPLECVVDVNGANFLLIHGHNGLSNTSRIENEVSKVRARYSARGIIIDYVISGHIHSAYISDCFSRSSGLPGANSYSDKALGLTSRASQNLYIVHGDKSIDGVKVDLQDFDRDNMYQVSECEDYRTVPQAHTVTIQSVII